MEPYITIAIVGGGSSVDFYADEDGAEVERSWRTSSTSSFGYFPRRRDDRYEIKASKLHTTDAAVSEVVDAIFNDKAPVRLSIDGVDEGKWRITTVRERSSSGDARTEWRISLESVPDAGAGAV